MIEKAVFRLAHVPPSTNGLFANVAGNGSSDDTAGINAVLAVVWNGWMHDLVPGRLRGVLHRALDFIADSRNAAGKEGGGTVRAVVAGFAVRDFRETGAAGGVQQSAPE